MTERTFSCNSNGLRDAQGFLESVNNSPKPAIVMDEIASNIVRCSGARDFSVGLDQTDESLRMVFTDNGVAFDPLHDAAVPDVSAAAEDRKIGGLGIFMVKKMAKSVEYRRQNDRNVLTIVL